MKDTKNLIQHIAPTIGAALGGPFKGVANKFMQDHLLNGQNVSGDNVEEHLITVLNDSTQLQKMKEIDLLFKKEMKALDVDVFALEEQETKRSRRFKRVGSSPQFLISICFLAVYFMMLAAIILIEASDTINMVRGENSLLGEIQILFGVLTAGVGQILSFWFGGFLRPNKPEDSLEP